MSASASRIREATQRLLRWEPTCLEVAVDGDWTDSNLAKEAGVSRATLYRHTEALKEWEASIAKIVSADAVAAAPRVRIRQLEAALASRATENAALQRTIDRLAQKIQYLSLALESRSRPPDPSPEILPIHRGHD